MVLGSGLGVLLVVGLIMVAAGLFTGSPIPLPGWPDLVHGEGGNPGVTAPAVAPDSSSTNPTPRTTPAPASTTTTASPTTHGNGSSHRPTKTPGKP
jgi:hypothetical protein